MALSAAGLPTALSLEQSELVTAAEPAVPPHSVILYSYSDEWGRRSPDRFRTCAAEQLWCQTTWNASLLTNASALLFHAPDHRNDTMPPAMANDPLQRPLYYFTDEAPPWFSLPGFLTQFDMISTYDLLSDAPRPYILGPDLLAYMRGKGQQALEEGAHATLMDFLAAKLARARANRTAPIAWFVSNCGAERSYYVAELIKHVPVDIYGGAHCLGSNLTLPDRNEVNVTQKEDELLRSTYFFYLSLENHNCRDYVTEKLYRPLSTGLIPIVDGPSDYAPFLPTSKCALQLDDYASPAELAQHVAHLLHQLDELASYLNFSQLSRQFVQGNDHNFDGPLTTVRHRVPSLADPTELFAHSPAIFSFSLSLSPLSGWCQLCEHAYHAKMTIQANGQYTRFPTRYRFPQEQLCEHDKWRAYNTPETNIVTSARSRDYRGPRMSGEDWWAAWERETRRNEGPAHTRPHPAGFFPVNCDVEDNNNTGLALTGVAVLEAVLLLAVFARWCPRPRGVRRGKEP